MFYRNALIGLMIFGSSSAFCHHSQAAYDLGSTLELTGKVIAFEWNNPHCWIVLDVVDGNKTGEWSIEMGNPRQLFRAGWRPATLQPGDSIRVRINPTKNGSHGGQFYAAEFANGDPIETAGD